MMYFLVLPQFMRHQIQNLPAWMRLTMALFGFLFPREALFPRLRGEQRWRDFLPVLASALVSPPSHRVQRHPDFKRWHCKMEHGFGFCFLIEYEDEMKKTLVTAGRRPMTFFFSCFVLFFSSFQEGAIVWRDIFEIFVRSPILYSKLLFLFGISSLEGPPSVQGMPYSLLPQYNFLHQGNRKKEMNLRLGHFSGDELWTWTFLCWSYWLKTLRTWGICLIYCQKNNKPCTYPLLFHTG